MIEFLRVFLCTWRAYKLAKASTGSAYSAITSHGVPQVACFVSVGREAWRVSVRAVEEFKPRLR